MLKLKCLKNSLNYDILSDEEKQVIDKINQDILNIFIEMIEIQIKIKNPPVSR